MSDDLVRLGNSLVARRELEDLQRTCEEAIVAALAIPSRVIGGTMPSKLKDASALARHPFAGEGKKCTTCGKGTGAHPEPEERVDQLAQDIREIEERRPSEDDRDRARAVAAQQGEVLLDQQQQARAHELLMGQATLIEDGADLIKLLCQGFVTGHLPAYLTVAAADTLVARLRELAKEIRSAAY